MLSRRIVAFEANIARLLLKQCSLWTYTLKDTIEPREASKRWTKLLKALREHSPDWCGIRVFELHPGHYGEFSHGLHVHLVSHCFFSDRVMKAFCEAHGWGHFDRRLILDDKAAFYIGKYLNKQRPGALKGMRLQSCFGPFDWTRLRQVVINSIRGNCFRAAAVRDWRDGREWDQRGWMEKLQLVARQEWEVIADNLDWDPEAQQFYPPPPPDRFQHLRPLHQTEILLS